MHSKNKKSMTRAEKQHVDQVASLPCVVCDDHSGSEVHEPEQGLWFISIPLCMPCHRGPDGWHGTRLRWKLRGISELQAINRTIQRMKVTA